MSIFSHNDNKTSALLKRVLEDCPQYIESQNEHDKKNRESKMVASKFADLQGVSRNSVSTIKRLEDRIGEHAAIIKENTDLILKRNAEIKRLELQLENLGGEVIKVKR